MILQDILRKPWIERVKLHKRLYGKPLWSDQPVSLNLDTQNRCPLFRPKEGKGCVYCNPQSLFVKHYSEMSLFTLKHLLDELKEKKIFLGYVCAEGNGDPLLERRFPQICRLIKKTIRTKVDVFSCGVLYANRDLLHTPALDDIRFTISASNPDLYLKVHGKPLFDEAVKTLRWVSANKYLHQRIWVNFVLYEDNAHDLSNWQRLFRGYYQDIRALHLGADRSASKQLDTKNPVLEFHRKIFFDRLIREELPCSVFHGIGVSAQNTYMQCIDLPYEYNWGHIEEIDILETYRKRLDLGLDHPGCRGCNQKNPYWRELFEKYVW